MENLEIVSWVAQGKVMGMYLLWYVFYFLLIQTTYMSIVNGYSAMVYKTNEKQMKMSLTSASALWAFFIMLHGG